MKERWPVIVFTTLLTLAVGVYLVKTLAAGMTCGAELKEIADNKAICGPVEFWINRYQSAWTALLTTSVAIAAALAAWLAVKGQIAEARYQTSVAHWQSLTDTVRAMSRDIFLLIRVVGTAKANMDIMEFGLTQQVHEDNFEIITKNQDHILEFMSEFIGSGGIWTIETENLRREAKKSAQSLTLAARNVVAELENATWGNSAGYGPRFSGLHASAAQEFKSRDQIVKTFINAAERERDELLELADKMRRRILEKARAF